MRTRSGPAGESTVGSRPGVPVGREPEACSASSSAGPSRVLSTREPEPDHGEVLLAARMQGEIAPDGPLDLRGIGNGRAAGRGGQLLRESLLQSGEFAPQDLIHGLRAARPG